ncbi:hypothetical protein IF1G_05531 [Cordyceps javanica]|uniref:Uncharacterized protein n=1 Tax=Cordyceps javanica TaxID=43265 RepID=A0A545V1X3_9HYPO|nr:hypothetical protein IF1G_05531 [Cordyceps javanica]
MYITVSYAVENYAIVGFLVVILKSLSFWRNCERSSPPQWSRRQTSTGQYRGPLAEGAICRYCQHQLDGSCSGIIILHPLYPQLRQTSILGLRMAKAPP